MIVGMATCSEGAAVTTVLLLSGTSEGPPLARMLLDAGFAVHATVTRAEACASLFGPLAGRLRVEARGFTEESLADFLAHGGADLVLDATHPFAVRITRLAHAACARLGVPFVRHERPDWQPPPGTHFADGFAEAADVLPTLGRRAVLTIGSKQLKHFAHLRGRVEMFARVLPGAASAEQARAAGFDAGHVLALRPPFSRGDNRALFEQCRVEVLLTKASGAEGGVAEKVLAAGDLGMRVLVVRRPDSEGIASVGSLEEAVRACLAHRAPGVRGA
jgi:precorrin-6A/cobalt-precorrin-6A reductase